MIWKVKFTNIFCLLVIFYQSFAPCNHTHAVLIQEAAVSIPALHLLFYNKLNNV